MATSGHYHGLSYIVVSPSRGGGSNVKSRTVAINEIVIGALSLEGRGGHSLVY